MLQEQEYALHFQFYIACSLAALNLFENSVIKHYHRLIQKCFKDKNMILILCSCSFRVRQSRKEIEAIGEAPSLHTNLAT